MKIIIEMPEPRPEECPFCSECHSPREVCSGVYLRGDYKKANRRAQAIKESADIVEKE